MNRNSRRGAVRIGAGSGFSGDRLEPALELVKAGNIDYLVFECLAERTIAIAQRAKQADPTKGYDPFLDVRMRSILPHCAERGVRIVTNMGAANPLGAAYRIAEIAREIGLGGLKIAAVTGDDVLSPVLAENPLLLGEKGRIGDLGITSIISANAYLGASPIVAALKQDAELVVTGRVADPALFLGPLIAEFGWSMKDWTLLGRGTVIGHLLECAGQLTGGYFSDPGIKDVPGLAHLGFPFADVTPDGNAFVGKVAGSGGRLDIMTCKEQLLYELTDPANYLTPDVTADFSSVEFHQAAADRVRVTGGDGRAPPETLKVSVGYQNGYRGEGQISYAGYNAALRGRQALDILRERLQPMKTHYGESVYELLGVDVPYHCDHVNDRMQVPEVRARVAARAATLADAERIGFEMEALYTNGPAGGGGVTRSATPVLAVKSVLMPRTVVSPKLEIIVA